MEKTKRGIRTIRDATTKDIPAIAEIHQKMGLDYKMPNLESPLFLVQKLVECDGKIVAACTLKIEAEAYLWVDPELSAREKVEAMTGMQEHAIAEAWEQGLDGVHCWVPEAVENRFSKRLKAMGFSRDRGPRTRIVGRTARGPDHR